jgi:hypothetical protein
MTEHSPVDGSVELAPPRPRDPRQLDRLVLWAENLGRSPDDPLLLDPTGLLGLWRGAAAEVAAWHRDGGSWAYSRERAFEHEVAPVAENSRWWVLPLYRTLYDPDGCGRVERRRGYFKYLGRGGVGKHRPLGSAATCERPESTAGRARVSAVRWVGNAFSARAVMPPEADR